MYKNGKSSARSQKEVAEPSRVTSVVHENHAQRRLYLLTLI